MLIGEVAARSGVSARMLRHYDRIGLVPPTGRSRAGYREYGDADLRRLLHVEGLRSLGLSLSEVARALDDPGFDPAVVVDGLVAAARERRAREDELLDRLAQVRAGAPTAWPDVLRTVGLLRALGPGRTPAARQRAALTTVAADPRDGAALAAALLAEDDPNAAGALRWAVVRAAAAAVPVLVAALADDDAVRRRRAVVALADVDDPDAVAALADAYVDPDPEVRARALLAGGRRGDRRAVAPLVGLVVEGRDDVEAAEALGVLAEDPDVRAEITRRVADAAALADPPARQRIAGALAEVPGDGARALLERLAADPARPVALTATAVLRLRRTGG
ncbi:MerR family transcriptional regulator [Cellulomonas iranensis]|uniref:MerR family transcriptional regulator n=1 Tax=Cellulomonas iranensis TaxID=76862 RepID=UPI003D7E0FCF